MQTRDKEMLRIAVMWLCLLAMLCLVMCLMGCQTAAPCICPELELPEVVEVPTEVVYLLPLPSPPVYEQCVDLSAVYNNFDECDLRLDECMEIIETNNRSVE